MREVGVNGEVVIHAQERKNEKLKKQNFGLRFILKARVRAECGDSATFAACDDSAARVWRECGESAAIVRIAAIASCVELEALI